MSTWDADARDVYYRAFDIAELEPGDEGEDYRPQVTTVGTTRAFATGLHPVPVERQPTPDELLRGIAIGMAFSLPAWFVLIGIVLFFAQH